MDTRTIRLAAQAALHGPERKKLRVDGYEFNVKPAQVTKHEGACTLIGTLSHHIRFRPDDQVKYRVVKEGGTVASAEVTGIERGGLSSLVKKVDGDIAAAVAKGEALLDGKWEGAARQIIAVVAARL